MDEKNDKCVLLDNGWVLCADGTLRENSMTGYGTVKKPQSEYERLQLVCKFWQMKLDLAIAEFDDKKTMLLGDARHRLSQDANMGGPCMDEAEAVALLTELKSKINYAREMLDEAETQLEKNTPPSLKKSMDITEQNRERLGDFISQVSAIEI